MPKWFQLKTGLTEWLFKNEFDFLQGDLFIVDMQYVQYFVFQLVILMDLLGMLQTSIAESEENLPNFQWDEKDYLPELDCNKTWQSMNELLQVM